MATKITPGGLAASPQLHAVPPGAKGIAAADMNGDGYPDMVVAAGSISILLRNPKAEFNAPVNYTLQSGSSAAAVALGDLNGDGSNDVVAASTYVSNNGSIGGTVDVAMNNGNGTLVTQYSYPLGGSPGGIAIGNFNGDGKPDVAAGYWIGPTGVGSGGISVLLGNGDGTLKPAVNYAVASFSVYCTITGDFNGDGRLDLAACGGAADFNFTTPGAVGILLGNGDGTFQTATLTQVGSPAGFPQAIAAGDVNGDGKLDLVASVLDSDGNNTIVLLLGNGDGTFRRLAPFSTPVAGNAVALLDLNGDGIPDLVVADSSESVYLLGNGDGTFQSPLHFDSGAFVEGFAVADWDADGVAGLAIAAENGTVMAMESALNSKLDSSPPALSITKSHTGNFTPGQQGAIYTISVSNAANAAPVSGTVTITDTLPSGLTLVSMTGANWNCSGNTCTHGDALVAGATYDTITVTVNVAATAPSPQVNMATVSGGGSASASATDPTTIGPALPSITPGGIVPISSSSPVIQPGEWVSIYGTNLASGTTTWTGNFPMSLGGTSVTIDGKAAYLSFVSPNQIDLQVPNDPDNGTVPVVVTTASGSGTSTETLAQFGPSFFLLDTKHVAGIILRSDGSGAYGGGTYDIIGPTGTSLGYATVAAKAGDSIALFGTGFGPTNPAEPVGQAFSGAAPTTNPVTLRINNVSVTLAFAGLSGAGLYQLNLTVPSGLGVGDVPLQASVGGAQTQAGVVISSQ